MPPLFCHLARRQFSPGDPSGEFSDQWTHPSDVFSVLLILGGDVVGRAIAQLAGSPLTPVAFSFGWVSYALTAVVSAIGENKLMPLPDCACKVINGRTGYVRDNSSWIIGRIVRDFESWMDGGRRNGPIRTHLCEMLDQRWEKDKTVMEKKEPGSGKYVARPSQAGLCVSLYKADRARPGYPGYDFAYFIGFATSVLQLGIAAIPCGIFGDWGILLVSASGIVLSFATGSLSQWSKEKWACRRNSEKTVVLTRGNGSQHAIVVIGDGKGLDLEDLAAGPTKGGCFCFAYNQNSGHSSCRVLDPPAHHCRRHKAEHMVPPINRRHRNLAEYLRRRVETLSRGFRSAAYPCRRHWQAKSHGHAFCGREGISWLGKEHVGYLLPWQIAPGRTEEVG